HKQLLCLPTQTHKKKEAPKQCHRQRREKPAWDHHHSDHLLTRLPTGRLHYGHVICGAPFLQMLYGRSICARRLRTGLLWEKCANLGAKATMIPCCGDRGYLSLV
ncbi:unnamed protein product, partial [Lymnaea stagnalis]